MKRTADATFRVEQRLSGWGEEPGERFGGRLRLDGEGVTLLIADVERHRILWLDLPTRRAVARFGQTDRPGAGILALNAPTAISILGRRAVVYDSGNQRLVKLMLER
jgi:hypothetical protein